MNLPLYPWCPVCDYPEELEDWDICRSCGVEISYDGLPENFGMLRERWLRNGRPWWSNYHPMPGLAAFDYTCRHYLGISGLEFLSRYDAGEFQPDPSNTKLMRVLGMLPFVRRV